MLTEISPTTMERVDKGFDYMDENAPGWRETINLDLLDLGDDNRCILGQWYITTKPDTRRAWSFYSGYMNALVMLHDSCDPCWAFQHGFTLFHGPFDELTAAWRQKFAEMAAKS